MEITTMLVQPLSAQDQTISLSAGPLEIDTDLIIDGQERCIVKKVLSPTQATIVRGAHGTRAGAYPKWTLVTVAVEAVEAVDALQQTRRQRERTSPILLAEPLPKSGTTITVSGGTLVAGARLGINDEWCEVRALLTPTQAFIQRGIDGSPTGDHDGGTAIEMILPQAARTAGRAAPVISGTTKQGACPMCGCTGDHHK